MSAVNKLPRPDNRFNRAEAAPALFRLLSDSALSRAALAACALPMAMAEAAPPHRLTYVNPAFEAFFGVQSSEALGQSLAGLLAPDEERLLQRALADGASPCHLVMRGKDGQTRHVELSLGALNSVEGRLTHWILAFADRSEVVRLLAELDRLKGAE